MGLNRNFLRMVAVLPVVGLCLPQPSFGQSDHAAKVRAHQEEVRQRIEESRRRMEQQRQNAQGSSGNGVRQGNTTPRQGNTTPRQGNTTPKIGNTTPKIGNTTPRTGTWGSGGSAETGEDAGAKHEMAKTEYLFRENTPLAYSIEVEHTCFLGKQKWLGLILLDTVTPTPLRSDGSGYDYGTVNARGFLLAFGVTNDGELKRKQDEDIRLPTEVNFQPMGASKYKMPEGNRTRFPGNMHRATGVIEAIFPRVPMFEGRNQNKISRDYLLQTSNGFGAGAISKVSGSGLKTELVNGNRAERSETMAVKDNQGNPLFSYKLHQVANFGGTGQLSSATTVFRNEEDGVDHQVVVQTRQISVEQARKVIQSMK